VREDLPAYAGNLKDVFGNVLDLRACADIVPEAAKARAEEYGIPKHSRPTDCWPTRTSNWSST
jgi:hypothetical protein